MAYFKCVKVSWYHNDNDGLQTRYFFPDETSAIAKCISGTTANVTVVNDMVYTHQLITLISNGCCGTARVKAAFLEDIKEFAETELRHLHNLDKIDKIVKKM